MGGLKAKKPIPAPPVTPPAPMPLPDTTSALQAKKKVTDLAMRRAGRASTILSDNPFTGSDYTKDKLG